MRTRCIEGYVLTTGAYTLDNPIRRVDELRSDIDTNYDIKPIERTYQPRCAKDVSGEKGRSIDVSA